MYLRHGLRGSDASAVALHALRRPRLPRPLPAPSDKEHSTIIYESPQPDTPLLRLGWNRQDPRYMATLLQVGGPPQRVRRVTHSLAAGKAPAPVFELCPLPHASVPCTWTAARTRVIHTPRAPHACRVALQDSPKVVVLDIRYPTLPVVELQRHLVGR